MQKDIKQRLCCDVDEMVNHIIIKFSKLIRKGHKSKDDWVEKVIHWELWNSLKFDHAD